MVPAPPATPATDLTRPLQRRVFVLPLGVRLVLTVDASKASFQLAMLRGRLRNTKPLLLQLANVLRAEARQAFADGGTPSNRWRRLAPSTIATKAIEGLPSLTPKGKIPRRLIQRGRFSAANILMKTGALRDSWGVKSDPNHVEVIDEASGTVRIGSKLPYAAYHQKGTDAYTIEAKNGKALAFTGAGGKMFIRRRVHHPGLPQRAVRVSEAGMRHLRDVATAYLQGVEAALLSGAPAM